MAGVDARLKTGLRSGWKSGASEVPVVSVLVTGVSICHWCQYWSLVSVFVTGANISHKVAQPRRQICNLTNY